MKKNILVTGGAGFIGSHLCENLLNLENNVFCLDDLSTGSEKNIEPLMKKFNDKFYFINKCVTKKIEIDEDIDEIYNLACPASPEKYQIDPIQTIKTSFLGALNTLELARSKKAKILQASTSEVYGDSQVSPQSEEYNGNVNIIGPRSCYDEGKRAAETLFNDYSNQHNINIRIARIFNTYGPNMNKNDGRVVSNFINQALGGEDITIYGDGSHTRSFCYIDDTINGLIKLMNSKENIRSPVNIGSTNEISIGKLADMCTSLSNSKSKIVYLPLPEDDPKQRKPNIDKAKNLLNWSPKIKIDKGLLKTFDYFSNII